MAAGVSRGAGAVVGPGGVHTHACVLTHRGLHRTLVRIVLTLRAAVPRGTGTAEFTPQESSTHPPVSTGAADTAVLQGAVWTCPSCSAVTLVLIQGQ